MLERHVFIGGGALLSTKLQDFYYAIGMPMFQGYGLSEATPVISSNSAARHKFGTSGVLVKPLDLKILDADGHEMPAGEKGEIVVRGENVMAGYWKNEESTAQTDTESTTPEGSSSEPSDAEPSDAEATTDGDENTTAATTDGDGDISSPPTLSVEQL